MFKEPELMRKYASFAVFDPGAARSLDPARVAAHNDAVSRLVDRVLEKGPQYFKIHKMLSPFVAKVTSKVAVTAAVRLHLGLGASEGSPHDETMNKLMKLDFASVCKKIAETLFKEGLKEALKR